MAGAVKEQWVLRIAWIVTLAAVSLQGITLLAAWVGRFFYPYDLEWMEGGMLGHAQQLVDHGTLYPEPSVHFIPYLYTPLYSIVVATIGTVLDVSYQVGRFVSIVSMGVAIGLVFFSVGREAEKQAASVRHLCALLAVGFVCAGYPWVGGWYDLVRVDSFFLAIVLCGLVGVRHWAHHPSPLRGRYFGLGMIMGLAFFTKQTGVLFAGVGGVFLLFLNWRKLIPYSLGAAVSGLGTAWVANLLSDGWFWTYVFEVHQAHDFNWDRFWSAIGEQLTHFPGLTTVNVAGCFIAGFRVVRGVGGRIERRYFLWLFAYVVSVLVGAIGWGTQWAHPNAFMPTVLFGAIAGGVASLVLIRGSRRWLHGDAPALVAVVVLLGGQLFVSDWQHRDFVPPATEEQKGDELIETIRAIPGAVWVPYHPWYARLAGKELYAHRMGFLDMRLGGKWIVHQFGVYMKEERFAAIVMNRPPEWALREMGSHYRAAELITGPKTVNGAITAPTRIYRPVSQMQLRGNERPLWEFGQDWKALGWETTGNAFGTGPVRRATSGQGEVGGYFGKRFGTSMHKGDQSTGTLVSPTFVIEPGVLSVGLGGGTGAGLKGEFLVNGKTVKIFRNTRASEFVHYQRFSVEEWEGQTGQFRFTDNETGGWGHLNLAAILFEKVKSHQ